MKSVYLKNKIINAFHFTEILSRFQKMLFFIVVVIFSMSLQAKQPRELIEEGNNFYKNNDFQKAVECYEQILETNYEAAELYYNLGNAYFRMGSYGPAILNYERALRLSPDDKDIKLNLDIANTRITDKIEEVPELFFSRIFKYIVNLFSYNAWATFCIIFMFITCIIACFYFLSGRYDAKKWSFYVGIVTLAVAILSFTFASLQFSGIKNNNEAIIIRSLAVVKSSPDENSVDKFIIHEGMKVHIEDSMPAWLKISLPNGSIGWVEKDALEII